MANYEEVEAFINAAFLELGPMCDAEWAQECAKILRSVTTENKTERERPPEYYRPTTHAPDPLTAGRWCGTCKATVYGHHACLDDTAGR